MLLSRSHSLDILQSTIHHLDASYDKIFRFLSYEFSRIGRSGAGGVTGGGEDLEVSPVMRECVRRLGRREEMLA
jgi:hypothetical protein